MNYRNTETYSLKVRLFKVVLLFFLVNLEDFRKVIGIFTSKVPH